MNMKQHFHPVYHLEFMNDIADSLVPDFTATGDIPNNSVIFPYTSTRWNWGEEESHASWEILGLGGAAYAQQRTLQQNLSAQLRRVLLKEQRKH